MSENHGLTPYAPSVELLIEQRQFSPGWPFRDRASDFDGKMDKMRERGINPAYRPALRRDEIEALAAQYPNVGAFHGGSPPDRPLRDVQALAWFTSLTSISLGSDISDFSPIASLPRLERLSIGEYGDFAGSHALRMRDCGEMAELKSVHLSLRCPWPDLSAMENWPKLAQILFNGNILAWEEVAMLPEAQSVALRTWGTYNTPLRDLSKLPEMPKAKILAVEGVASLEGIERYRSVLNLELGGNFRDLKPLEALSNLTALKLTGEFFQDLSPLVRLPKLREVRFVRERSIDLALLADAPALRRVEMERCSMMRMELAALNAGLLPEAVDFEAANPRPVGPLKFFVVGKENEAGKNFFRERVASMEKQRERWYDGDALFAGAELRVIIDRLQSRFDTLLGRGWGLQRDCYIITLKRFQDTVRVLEVIRVLQEESARSRFPKHFLLHVEPHGDMSEDLEEMKERDKAEADENYWLAELNTPEAVLRENEEWRELRERRYTYLQREHLLQLRGDEVDPELLSLPKEEEEPAKTPEDEEPISPPTDDGEGGGVAIASPPPPPPDTTNLGEELAYYLDVYEDCIVANGHWVQPARYNLGMEPVEWSAEQAVETREGEL